MQREQARHKLRQNESRKLEQISRVSLRPSRAKTSEAKKKPGLSQSACRGVRARPAELNQPARDQKELGGGELIQQQVSKTDNTVGLDKIVGKS